MNEEDLKTDKASAEDVGETEAQRWNTVDWEKAERHVNSLQSKIAQAQSEGKTERVRKLQRLLIHSLDAKLLATRKVTSNKGKYTPGMDGEIWNTPAKRFRGALSLSNRGYKASPLRRVRIPKKGKKGKTRPLGIPTMYDRAMQALHALALEPVAEVSGDRHSYGFRKGRSTQDASARLFNALAGKNRAQWILEGDIKGCFDHISHDWLMDNVPMDKKVLKQFLSAGFTEQGSWHATDEGTPQGGVISPILANLALDGIDQLLDDKYHTSRKGNMSRDVASRHKINFVRYADDFVITANTEALTHEVKDFVEAHLLVRGLELSGEKTLITHIEEGFDFLGWNFRKYNGKLIIQPSKASINDFVRDMHQVILRIGKAMTQEQLIRVMTPKIRGFANYHRHVCSTQTFAKIDYHIFNMLFRWAKRRHPNKNSEWRYRKYWVSMGNRKHIFGSNESYLPCMEWQHIVRHVALQNDKNPYQNPVYFEERKQQLSRRNAYSFRRAAVT